MPGFGPPIDLTGEVPVPGDGLGPEPDTETGANPVADGGGALGGQQEEQEDFHDPYADDDVALPKHVVVRINGVTLQRLASYFMGNILSLLSVFVERFTFLGNDLHSEGQLHHDKRRCRQRQRGTKTCRA